MEESIGIGLARPLPEVRSASATPEILAATATTTKIIKKTRTLLAGYRPPNCPANTKL
jgi:hypothetical protein